MNIEPLDLSRPPAERRHHFRFSRVGAEDWVTLRWKALASGRVIEYDIAMDRIRDPLSLLQWLAHLGQKGWPGMTADEVAGFIKAVCERKGWDLWGRPL